MYRRDFYIGGEWVKPESDERQSVISPSTEEIVGEIPTAATGDLGAAVRAAREAFDEGPWPRMAPSERAEVLTRVAELLSTRDAALTGVTVDEMGCAVSTASPTGMAVSVLNYYASLARTFEFERHVVDGDRHGIVLSEPVGVVGTIVPWNAPVTLAVWKVAPALAAGCTVVVKPPPEAPLSNYILAEVFDEAGVPPGVFNLVPGGRDVGEYLVTHHDTDKIAFTGSTAAGKRIMSLCSDHVKRLSLELGGKSAGIVLDDADATTVIPSLVSLAMRRSGQVCGSQTRVLIPRSRYAELLDAAAAAAEAVPVGDPHDPKTVVGPLVSERQRDRVENYMKIAVDEGAKIVAGGRRPSHLAKGWYVEPTILSEVDNSMRVAREEIFGPVLCFIPYENDDDAVRIANDSSYGLAGGVWTADDARGVAVARKLRTGSVTINLNAPPFPLVPFGGFKESGLGRELGPEGLMAFLETCSIGIPASLQREV